MPLFDDAERAQVGTCFKHNGRLAAIQLGLTLIGPRLGGMVQHVQTLACVQPGDAVFVYCWRGGMRSSSVCWLLGLCGFRASALSGGYRSFRRWVQSLLHSARAPPLGSAPGTAGGGDTEADTLEAAGDGDGGGGGAVAAAVASSLAAAEGDGPAAAKAAAEALVAAHCGAPASAAAELNLEASSPPSARASGGLFSLAKAARDAGRMDDALLLYGRAMQAGHPRVDQCLLMAGTCQAKRGSHAEALALYDASLLNLPQSQQQQQHPPSPHSQQQQQPKAAVAAAATGGGGGSGRGGEAHAILRVQDLRAASLEVLGRIDEAVSALRLAIAIEPSARRSKDLQRLVATLATGGDAPAADDDDGGCTGKASDGGRANGGHANGSVVVAPSQSATASAALEKERLSQPPPLPLEPPLAPLRVLGGRTGSGKTAMLHALRREGEQILDLEGLAEHMGSAFGRVGQSKPQPSNEMFENLVGLQWRRADASRPLWVEHEGRHVGTCLVPLRVYEALRAPELLVMLEVNRAARVRHLVRIYSQIEIPAEPKAVGDGGGTVEPVADGGGGGLGGSTQSQLSTGGGRGGGGGGGGARGAGGKGVQAAVVAELVSSVESLRKRRGGAATAAALEQLAAGDFASVADSALEYYDGLYDAYAATSRREHVLHVECTEAGQTTDARRVLDAVRAEAWRGRALTD